MNAPRMDSWLPPWPAYGLPMASPWQSLSTTLAESLGNVAEPTTIQVLSYVIPSILRGGCWYPYCTRVPSPTLPSPPREDAFPQPLLRCPGSSLSWPSGFYLLEAFPPGSISAVDCLTAGPLQPPRTQGSPCEARAPWQGHLDLQLRL